MKKSNMLKKINVFLLLLLAFLFSVQIYLSDIVATAGSELAFYEKQLAQLQKEHEYITNQYYSLTSLRALSRRAESNGYAFRELDYIKPYNLASR